MKVTKLRYLPRIKEVLTVFIEEGFGFILKKAHLHHYVPFPKRWKVALKKREDAWKPEVHLREALERLGPTFVKLGQTLSLRPDVLPPKYIDELEKMQDHVPPMPYSDVKEIVEEECGGKISDLFASFEKKPVASASLAQVHKAQLDDGKEVAVKVLRKNIDKTVKQDIDILMLLAHWIDERRVLPNIELVPIVEEFKRWTLRELNLKYEAVNMNIVRDNFRHSDKIIIPEVMDELSTERVLISDFIKGVPIHDIEKVPNKKNIRKIMRTLYRSAIRMVFYHGMFHADPHPGNILITDSKIALVDFGIVGRFDPELRLEVVKLFNAGFENDADKVVDILLSMQSQDKKIDRIELRKDVQDILDQLRFEKLKDIELSKLIRQELEIIHRYKINIPIDFVLFAKTIATLEGVGLRYSPDLKIMSEAQSSLKAVLKKEKSPKTFLRKTKKHFEAYHKLIDEAPGPLIEALKNLKDGKIDIEVSPDELTDLRAELEKSSGNVAIGLVVAGLIVSSSIVMEFIPTPKIFGIPLFSAMGFTLAFMLTAWLIKRTVFVKIERGEY